MSLRVCLVHLKDICHLLKSMQLIWSRARHIPLLNGLGQVKLAVGQVNLGQDFFEFIYWLFSARLQYAQCFSNGDTAVFLWAIYIIFIDKYKIWGSENFLICKPFEDWIKVDFIYLLVPCLQMSCSDFISMKGYQDNNTSNVCQMTCLIEK